MRFDRPNRQFENPEERQKAEDTERLGRVERAAKDGDASYDIVRWFLSASVGERILPRELLSELRDLAVLGYKKEAASFREYASNPPNNIVPPAEAIQSAKVIEERAERLASQELDQKAFFDVLREALQWKSDYNEKFKQRRK